MAEQVFALGEYDQLHHFIAAGVWDAAPVETELLVQADRLVGGSDAVLVIDDTAIPKSIRGVSLRGMCFGARQDRRLQTLVSLVFARGEVPVTLALRIFIAELDKQSGSVEASGYCGGVSNSTDKAGVGSGGN